MANNFFTKEMRVRNPSAHVTAAPFCRCRSVRVYGCWNSAAHAEICLQIRDLGLDSGLEIGTLVATRLRHPVLEHFELATLFGGGAADRYAIRMLTFVGPHGLSPLDRKSTRLNSSNSCASRLPSSA